MDFLETSSIVQKQLGMKHRAKNGIFFTPKSLRDIVFDHISILPTAILEPSCGSGEFLVDCHKRYPDAVVTGVELDETLSRVAKENSPQSTILNTDFLKFEGGKYDLIIGNPPFVQIKTNTKNFSGRTNLYIEFLHKCITYHLADRGILAMVLTSTIANGHFSQTIRDLIFSKKIVHFETIRNHTFKDTKAGVSILVIENSPGDNERYNFDGFLSGDAEELRRMVQTSSKKLKDLDVSIKYGMMTKTLQEYFSTNTSHIPFVLKKDVKQKEVKFDANRLFIDKDIKTHKGRCILLLRSNGVVMGSEYELKFSLFESESFLFDICLVGIFGKDIDKVYASLCDRRTEDYLKKICGSGRLTKKILLNLPIFVEKF